MPKRLSETFFLAISALDIPFCTSSANLSLELTLAYKLRRNVTRAHVIKLQQKNADGETFNISLPRLVARIQARMLNRFTPLYSTSTFHSLTQAGSPAEPPYRTWTGCPRANGSVAASMRQSTPRTFTPRGDKNETGNCRDGHHGVPLFYPRCSTMSSELKYSDNNIAN
jgi:hypothetical protein